MKTTNVNGQNGVATSANTSFSLYADSWANFGYIKRMEFTELNKTELISFIAQPICWYKSQVNFCLEFGDERYTIYIHKNEKGYYVTVSETSSKTVQRPVREVIRHYCDCFRLTEKKIDNIVNYIYDLVADYFYGYHKADITKSEFEKEYTDNLNSPDTSEECDNMCFNVKNVDNNSSVLRKWQESKINTINSFFKNAIENDGELENVDITIIVNSEDVFPVISLGDYEVRPMDYALFNKKSNAPIAMNNYMEYMLSVLSVMCRMLGSNYYPFPAIKHEWSEEFLSKYYGRPVSMNEDGFYDTDASEEPDAFIGLEDASEVCDNNMMACVDKYGQEFIERVLNEYADVVYNAVSEYDLDDTIKYCVKGALDFMEYDPENNRLVGCSDVPDLGNWEDEEEFCNYFEDAYCFDWDSCQEFYQEYCNDIWHFANEYDDRMEDALKDFDKGSVFDKMPYNVKYNNEGYINVYIGMGYFLDNIKKNMVFNADKAQLFKYEDLGMSLYNMLDSNNVDVDKHFKDLNDSYLFCRDLIDMLPMVTDVKLYDDGLYFWYKDITDMTIREFYELHIDGYWCIADPINNYVDEFLSPDAVEIFNNLVEKDEDWTFYIYKNGDLYVSGHESIFERYFNDDVPMVQVYGYLMDKMNEEIIKTETEIEKEIEGAEYEVLKAFEIADAQGENSFNVDYDEWWDYVLGETPDWIKDKYYDKFCDVLYDYFVKYAKDYDYGVEEIDGGISLEKPDYNN